MQWAVSAAALALLGGCALAPAPQPAAAPAGYPAYSDRDTGAPSAATIGWRDFFREPELQALITRALASNQDLRAAAARIAQARAAVRIRGADLAPQASASAGMTKLGLPDNLARLLRDDTLTSYDGIAMASWEVDLFGRLRNQRAAAFEQYLASGEARRALAASLVAQVAAGYLADREYAERLALARDTLANREESLRILSRRYAVGSGSKVEVTQAETLRTQALAEIQATELARAQNRNALSLLVGGPVRDADFTRPLDAVGLDQPIPNGLPSDLLVNRPDLVAAEHRLRAASANIRAARAAFFPSISLTAAGGTTSRDLDGLFDSGTGVWLFRPSISLPIFTAGKLTANLRYTEAQRDELVAGYDRAVQQAFRDVADALAQRRWFAEQIGTVNASIAALTERARLARLRYDAGRSAYLEVLDAERDLFSARQKLVQLRRAELASGVALYAALGGGAPESFTDTQAQGRNP